MPDIYKLTRFFDDEEDFPENKYFLGIEEDVKEGEELYKEMFGVDRHHRGETIMRIVYPIIGVDDEKIYLKNDKRFGVFEKRLLASEEEIAQAKDEGAQIPMNANQIIAGGKRKSKKSKKSRKARKSKKSKKSRRGTK